MHKQPPETVDLPRKQQKQEPLDIALQGFFYISLTIMIMIVIGAVCLLLEAAHWITT